MTYSLSGPVKLRTSLADYPVTMALKRSDVSSPLVEFDFCGPKVAHDFQARVRQNSFDAGELAIVTFLQAKAYGNPDFLLPAPISGRFQHHCIGYNSTGGALKPRDIEGRELGVRSYAQTAGLWVRGILQHEYGVDLDKVTWLTTDKGQLAEYRDSPNCQMLPKGKRIDEMLYSGEIAAAILENDMPNDPRISTLVPDAPAAAKQWYEREHAIPINHMCAVHRDLSKSRPDVIRELFKKIVASRAAANSTAAIPPFGLEANRKAIGMASDWSYEQKITPRRLSVDELFDENTAAVVAEETAS